MGEYAAVTTDWREPLLHGASLLDVRLARRDPGKWPGYEPAPSVRAYRLRGTPDSPGPVAVLWDFNVQGGSFGEDDATTFVAAARHAAKERVPLVTLVRSGGTRLQEGMAALVGIPRARMALLQLAQAGLPHLSVADAPTTGGVWIAIAAAADVRVAIEGATVGFAGPRVVEAMTGSLPEGSHTAETAYAAGLVDALITRADIVDWLAMALRMWTPSPVVRAVPPPSLPSDATGWDQVLRSRSRTVGGRAILERLLTDRFPLQARYGDRTVAAMLGRLDGRPVVGVALAAEVAGRPTPDGYRLAARAYRLASSLALPVVSLVDTPGADPGSRSENDGIATAMGEALDALLLCASPTLALVHGEGGSGGALAAATADRVLVTDESYFAAIGPEGATAALRRPKQECADRMGITPADLLALGFADALATPDDVSAHLSELVAQPADSRREVRLLRWSAALPGSL
ncbi:MAG: carboxyl transferase [Frankiales bacterium]|nr:carboxyl transferase [Frankiales bacterium]